MTNEIDTEVLRKAMDSTLPNFKQPIICGYSKVVAKEYNRLIAEQEKETINSPDLDAQIDEPAYDGVFPAQCPCGHLYLEKYMWKTPQNGNIGFCWCGFCRTRYNVRAIPRHHQTPAGTGG